VRILLVRHSEAASPEGVEDAARPLTAQGRDVARRVAEAVFAQGVAPSGFVTSPRLRARQTAEIFAEALGFLGPVQNQSSLSYTIPASQAVHDLEQLSGTIFAFGHMPTIAEIGNLLSRGRGMGAFAPCEALFIENGRAQWSIDPDSLKLVRR